MVHLIKYKDNTYSWLKYPGVAGDIMQYNQMLAHGYWNYDIPIDEIKLGLEVSTKFQDDVIVFSKGLFNMSYNTKTASSLLW